MSNNNDAQIPILPDGEPVTMPELPEMLVISTPEQFKALGDPLRTQITHVLQNKPATTKQLAQLLGMAPGTLSHHMRILERAGLIRVVALRMTRGTIAKYYARTAYMYGFAPEHAAVYDRPIILDMARQALEEIEAAQPNLDENDWDTPWFPHRQINDSRMLVYAERIAAIVADFLHEPIDPTAKVQSLFIALFTAPPVLQARENAAEAKDEKSSAPEQ